MPEIMETMKAALIYCYGAPDVLRYEDTQRPVLQAGEILIETFAIGLNPADFKYRAGMFSERSPKRMPLILGMDVAGIVRAKGEGAQGFSIGDRVLAHIPSTRMGCYAEYVAAPAVCFALIPPDLGWTAAAAIPTPASTGVQLVEDDLNVTAGQTVLVTGAAGGVGRAAVFAAKRRGARAVAAVRASQTDDVSGADAIWVLDQPGQQGREGPFDAIADTVGGEAANRLLDFLRPGGVLSSVATTPVGDTRGLNVVSRRFALKPDPARLAAYAVALVAQQATTPPIRVMKLSEAALAHALMERSGAGKIVLLTDAHIAA